MAKKCCDPIVIPSVCTKCDNIIDSECVINEAELPNIGTSANATQAEINEAIDTVISNGGNCTLTWSDLTVLSPFTVSNLPTAQTPQYSIDPCNGRIYLRGVFELVAGVIIPDQVLTAFTLPIGARPIKIKGFARACNDPFNSVVFDVTEVRLNLILTDGSFTIQEFNNNNVVPIDIGFSIDGIVYDVN